VTSQRSSIASTPGRCGSCSLPLRLARVHGVGETYELDDVLTAIPVVRGGPVAIDDCSDHVAVHVNQLQPPVDRPALGHGSRLPDAIPLLGPRMVSAVCPHHPRGLGARRGGPNEQEQRSDHRSSTQSHHRLPRSASLHAETRHTPGRDYIGEVTSLLRLFEGALDRPSTGPAWWLLK